MPSALYRVGTNCFLKTVAASAFAGEVTDVSPVTVRPWESKLGPLFADPLADMEGTERTFAERWAGYDILIVDAGSAGLHSPR